MATPFLGSESQRKILTYYREETLPLTASCTHLDTVNPWSWNCLVRVSTNILGQFHFVMYMSRHLDLYSRVHVYGIAYYYIFCVIKISCKWYLLILDVKLPYYQNNQVEEIIPSECINSNVHDYTVWNRQK